MQMEKEHYYVGKAQNEHGLYTYTNGLCSSFSYGQMVPCLLVIAIGRIRTELFSRYSDCVREFYSLAELLLFQSSFKLGARMMAEMMAE